MTKNIKASFIAYELSVKRRGTISNQLPMRFILHFAGLKIGSSI